MDFRVEHEILARRGNGSAVPSRFEEACSVRSGGTHFRSGRRGGRELVLRDCSCLARHFYPLTPGDIARVPARRLSLVAEDRFDSRSFGTLA
jgi:hypothetical protein